MSMHTASQSSSHMLICWLVFVLVLVLLQTWSHIRKCSDSISAPESSCRAENSDRVGSVSKASRAVRYMRQAHIMMRLKCPRPAHTQGDSTNLPSAAKGRIHLRRCSPLRLESVLRRFVGLDFRVVFVQRRPPKQRRLQPRKLRDAALL